MFALSANGSTPASIDILIDVDNDTNTGQMVSTSRGYFFGADERLHLSIDSNGAARLTRADGGEIRGGAIVRDGFAEVTLRLEEVLGLEPRIFVEGAIAETLSAALGASRFRIPLAVVPNATPRVWYVRNGGTDLGDGTAAAPFNRLASAQSSSAPGDIIFVFAGDGTTRGQEIGIVLKDGQSLIGEGVALVVDGVTVVPAGRKPLITNLGGPAILLANNNTIRGLTISEPKGAGIVDDGALSGLTLDNIAVLRPAGEAIRLSNVSGTVTIAGSELDTAPGELVKIVTTSSLSLEVTNSKFLNTAPPGGDDGLQLTAGGSGAIRVVARGNTFQNLLGHAIDISGRGVATDAFTLDVDVSNNQFLNRFTDGVVRGANGLSIKAQEHELVTVAITNNTFNTVGGLGAIALQADDSGTLRGRVSTNTITAVDGNGIDVGADETARVDLTIEDNTIRQAGRGGIAVTGFPEKPDLNLIIRNNRISSTQREGVAVTLFGGTTRASLTGNEVSTTGTGIALTNNVPGVFVLTGDPSKSAQDNLKQTNTGSVSTSGTISVAGGRRRSVRR